MAVAAPLGKTYLTISDPGAGLQTVIWTNGSIAVNQYFANATLDNSDSWMFQLYSIAEMDKKSNPVSTFIMDGSQQSWHFATPSVTTSTYGEGKKAYMVQNVNLTATLQNMARVVVWFNYLPNKTTTTTTLGKTLKAGAGSLVWGIQISNWTLATPGNTLQVTLNVSTVAANGKNSMSIKSSALQMGTYAGIALPKYAAVNTNDTSASASYKYTKPTSTTSALLLVNLPTFTNGVQLDPFVFTMDVSDYQSHGKKGIGAAGTAAIIIILLLVLFAGIAAVVYWKFFRTPGYESV